MLGIKNYIFTAISAVLLASCGYFYISNSSLESELGRYKEEKAQLLGATKQAGHEANATTVRIHEKIVYREKQSEPIYRYIETFKGDANASDCDNNMSLLRSFTF